MTLISHSVDAQASRQEISPRRRARLDLLRIAALSINIALWVGLFQLANLAVRAH